MYRCRPHLICIGNLTALRNDTTYSLGTRIHKVQGLLKDLLMSPCGIHLNKIDCCFDRGKDISTKCCGLAKRPKKTEHKRCIGIHVDQARLTKRQTIFESRLGHSRLEHRSLFNKVSIINGLHAPLVERLLQPLQRIFFDAPQGIKKVGGTGLISIVR